MIGLKYRSKSILYSYADKGGYTDGTCEEIYRITLVCHGVIPGTIPAHIRNVELRDFDGDLTITHANFVGSGWETIENLTISHQTPSGYTRIKEESFRNVKRVTEIHIHVAPGHMAQYLFVPLKNLRVLDLTNCSTFSHIEVFSNFRSPNVLTKLEKLILVNAASNYRDGFNFSSEVFEAIAARPIAYLDISHAVIGEINDTAGYMHCNGIVDFYARGTKLGRSTDHSHVEKTMCKYLDILDIRSSRSLRNEFCVFPGTRNVQNATVSISNLFALISNARIIVISDLCEWSVPKRFYNNTDIKVTPAGIMHRLEEIDIGDNNLQYLDIELSCTDNYIVTGLKNIWMRSNGLKFIHPTILPCVSNEIELLDISRNQLSFMYCESRSSFEELFTSLYGLRTLNMSRNQFDDLSRLNLIHNKHLTLLDLSDNKLTNTKMLIDTNNSLKEVDFSNNVFQEFDFESIDILNKIVAKGLSDHVNVSINLEGNPFVCSECQHLKGIQWMLRHAVHLKDFHQLTCSNQEHKLVDIDDNLVHELQASCNKHKRAGLIVIIVCTCVLSLIGLVLSIKLWRGQRIKILGKRKLLKLLHEQASGFDFLVFLSYSSGDDEFVQGCVYGPLEQALREVTGIRRQLVCTGDMGFRIGQPIHDEMVVCMRKSTVIMIILSDNFLESNFCQLEFQQAYQLGKPVLLMVKDKVSLELMPPAMRELYRKYARVHWSIVDGTPEMKSSWKSVSQSILSIATKDRQWHH